MGAADCMLSGGSLASDEKLLESQRNKEMDWIVFPLWNILEHVPRRKLNAIHLILSWQLPRARA